MPIKEIIKKIYSYGIVADASFILGFDNENSNTVTKLINCIQEAGISMAMVGTLHALPNTQFAARLKKEGRLFEEGTTIRDENYEIDQMSNGLNFITDRPRIEILNDYIKIVKHLYSPENYYKRVTYMGLNLKRENKYKPSFRELFKIIRAFFRVCKIAGFSNTTGILFWKLFFTILWKNPKAIEPVLSMATMYIHFNKHAGFIVDLTQKKINYLGNYGEKEYNQLMINRTSLPLNV